MKKLVSKFKDAKSTIKSCDISISDYIELVKNGETKVIVEAGRVQKKVLNPIKEKTKDIRIKVKEKKLLSSDEQKLYTKYRKEKSKYDLIKQQCPCISGSCTMDMTGRRIKNISKTNGYIVIDIDTDVDEELISILKQDKYSCILHRSFGGDGICIFVKINTNPDAFRLCFDELAQYYRDEYDIEIDTSCKDKSRLRFISYDPDIFVNADSIRFKNKKRKETPTPVLNDFIFLESDFKEIVQKIVQGRVAICDSYAEYLNVGFAIANKFGYAGYEYFKAIASCSLGYNEKHCQKQYRNCILADNGHYGRGITISTVYYYCKEAGLELYTERTKQIVRTTSISKQNKNKGNSLEGVKDVLEVKGINITEDESKLISHIWNSKTNYLKGVTAGDSPIEKLTRYILETCDPFYDVIKNRIFYEKGRLLTDNETNDLYIGASSLFFEDFKVSKTDINNILNSSVIRRYDPIKEFFDVNVDEIETGYINAYADLLPYKDEDQKQYNRWVFKKWIIGGIHNWVCGVHDMEVCPFCLVLTGPHGNGKSTFMREILPPKLRNDYFLEEQINNKNKDSKIKMGQYLILCNEEFGGMAIQDVKAFKAFSDMRVIDERQAFRQNAETWKRRALLGGTTNEKNILKDVTGNRRILPVNTWCGRIDVERLKKFDTESLLLEAYKLYAKGWFDWRIYSDEDQQYLEDHNKEMEDSEPFGDVFFEYFSTTKTERFDIIAHMKPGQIIDWMNKHTSLKPNKHNINEMFQRVGITGVGTVKIGGKSKYGYYKLYRSSSTSWEKDVKNVAPF